MNILWWTLVFLLLTISNSFAPLLKNCWYPVARRKDLKTIQKILVNNEPYILYRSTNNSFVMHTDICPHQGASLSEGWINEFGNLHCPYHGLEFCNGVFCKIPDPSRNPKSFQSRIRLQTYPICTDKDWIYYANPETNETSILSLYEPPEETDEQFRSIEGVVDIDQYALSVTENVLDMLHISYIHSFGNLKFPLPREVTYKKLSETSGRSTFYYTPADMTISTKIGRSSNVLVQNEFHLPSTTITRVFAKKTIKTVMTRALPISPTKTRLYWKVYRNFWIDPYTPEFSIIGDVCLDFLMKRTLQEDMSILQKLYPSHRIGPLMTKFDITILKFREVLQSFLQK